MAERFFTSEIKGCDEDRLLELYCEVEHAGGELYNYSGTWAPPGLPTNDSGEPVPAGRGLRYPSARVRDLVEGGLAEYVRVLRGRFGKRPVHMRLKKA